MYRKPLESGAMMQFRNSARNRVRRFAQLAAVVASFLFSAAAVAAGALIPGTPVQSGILALVRGKGEPVNVPSLHNQQPGVVLWDELPGAGGKSESLQMGDMNLQSNSMLSSR